MLLRVLPCFFSALIIAFNQRLIFNAQFAHCQLEEIVNNNNNNSFLELDREVAEPELARTRRSLSNSHSSQYPASYTLVMDSQNNTRNLYGAIILSEAPVNASSQALQSISARVHNYQQLQQSLPFELARWSSVSTGPCPQWPDGHRTERGLIWAHYRIYRDFAFFDPVTAAIAARKLKNTTTSNSTTNTASMLQKLASSEGNDYVIYSDGRWLKRGKAFNDDDLLLIFEDDALATVSALNDTLITEFRDGPQVDILYLGWCEGRLARPVPLCAHAYAITRRAAKKLVHYLEPCGLAIDEQLVLMAKNNWLSYRRAMPSSYDRSKLRPEFASGQWGAGDKTTGIFRQCKTHCGSINGHRRRALV